MTYKKYLRFLFYFSTAVAVVFLCLFFVKPVEACACASEFITTWKTDNPGVSANNQITIPTIGGPTYNYDIDWGDSNSDTGVTGNITHTYAVPGTYTVVISGTFPEIFFANDVGTDASKILSIEQWGTTHWASMYMAFAGCHNLVIHDTAAPDLSGVTNAEYMFLNANSINSNLNNWDVSTITDFYGMFQSNLLLDQPFDNWDVSNAQDMGYMFENDTAFNQDLRAWGPKLSHVTDMDAMFQLASHFNQPLNTWDVSSVTSMGAMFDQATVFNQDISDWDVSHVTNMSSMFYGAFAFDNGGAALDWGSKTGNVQYFQNMFNLAPFNQDISGWDVSSATNMAHMFDADSFFNQDISTWNVGNVTNMAYMFYNNTAFDQDVHLWDISDVTDMTGMFLGATLSPMHYDSLLSGWSHLVLHTNLTFDAGNSTYCSSNIQRANIISMYSWSITDGGTNCHSLTYSAGPNGSLSGSAAQRVAHHGSSDSITAVPNSRYIFTGWSDGSIQNPRTDANVTGDIAVTANFSRIPGGGGSALFAYVNPPVNIATPILPLVEEKQPTILSPILYVRNLKIASRGDDVKALQQFLNTHGFTVRSSGSGSAGNETIYFGPATKNALKLFQEANAEIILKPLGLIKGTGFFYPATRKAVNEMLK